MTAPTTPMQPGDAWRHCSNLTDPEDFATVPDWRAVQRELVQALRAVGHPAGG